MRRQANKNDVKTDPTALLPYRRTPDELRAAQLGVATSVMNDVRYEEDWERELETRDLLEILGLYRRI